MEVEYHNSTFFRYLFSADGSQVPTHNASPPLRKLEQARNSSDHSLRLYLPTYVPGRSPEPNILMTAAMITILCFTCLSL